MVTTLIAAASALIAAVVAAVVAAHFGHSRWLRETRLRVYSDFLTAAYDSLERAGSGDRGQHDTLEAAERSRLTMALVAPNHIYMRSAEVVHYLKLIANPRENIKQNRDECFASIGLFQLQARDHVMTWEGQRLWRSARHVYRPAGTSRASD